jgi:uncharacterized membrane protein YeaQ/YmgE (transglycosylase-associated protein family)
MIGTIVVGLIAGLLARALHPGDDKLGLIKTTLLGVLGAYSASFIGQQLGFYSADEKTGLVGAVIGAVLLLSVYNLYQRRVGQQNSKQQANPSDSTEV